jgi:exodeoxyribonuclease V alpha subunit
LTPFRRSTSTGVNELNKRLQKIAISDMTGECVTSYHNRFYCGDKVMFMKNAKGLCNGDVGRITVVSDDTLTVDFGRGKPVVLKEEDLENLELAYACTIHKSQGSEYACVIMVISNSHFIMLKKNLIYTGLTRAKKKLICCTDDQKNIEISAKTTDLNLRRSRLASFLQRGISSNEELK